MTNAHFIILHSRYKPRGLYRNHQQPLLQPFLLDFWEAFGWVIKTTQGFKHIKAASIHQQSQQTFAAVLEHLTAT
jgi:hypothetical protein